MLLWLMINVVLQLYECFIFCFKEDSIEISTKRKNYCLFSTHWIHLIPIIWVFFPSKLTNFLTAAEYRTIQFSSDTIYTIYLTWGIYLRSLRLKGPVSQGCPPTLPQTPTASSRLSPMFYQPAINWTVPRHPSPLRFSNCYNGLQNSGKHFTYYDKFTTRIL